MPSRLLHADRTRRCISIPRSWSICRPWWEIWSRLNRPYLIGSEIYRISSYGGRHPLAIPRVSAALDLIRAMGWLDEGRYHRQPARRRRSSSRAFTIPTTSRPSQQRRGAAARAAEEDRDRYNIGRNGNPMFPEIFRRPATACGGTLEGGRAAARRRHRLFAGRRHPSRPARSRQRLLLFQRPRARHPGAARSGLDAHLLRRCRRPSWRRRAGRLRAATTACSPVDPRDRALAHTGGRATIAPAAGAQPAGARRLQRQRAATSCSTRSCCRRRAAARPRRSCCSAAPMAWPTIP